MAKGQHICRIKNWKIKNAIYMSKTNLKNNTEKIFITKDLTKTRQFIVKELNTQKRDNKIHSFWTFDGRIFAKRMQTVENSSSSVFRILTIWLIPNKTSTFVFFKYGTFGLLIFTTNLLSVLSKTCFINLPEY